jgi:hypothetical protein
MCILKCGVRQLCVVEESVGVIFIIMACGGSFTGGYLGEWMHERVASGRLKGVSPPPYHI